MPVPPQSAVIMDIAAAATFSFCWLRLTRLPFTRFMRSSLLAALCAKTGVQALLGLQLKDGVGFYACLDISEFLLSKSMEGERKEEKETNKHNH